MPSEKFFPKEEAARFQSVRSVTFSQYNSIQPYPQLRVCAAGCSMIGSQTL